MTPIKDIDPLGSPIPVERAAEFGTITHEFTEMAALTVKQEKVLERLITAAYLAGREDYSANS